MFEEEIMKLIVSTTNFDISKIESLSQCIEKIKLEGSLKEMKNFIAKNNFESESNTRFIIENKFLRLEWEVILEDTSSKTFDLGLIKVHLKIFYINIPSLELRTLELTMDEKNFHDFYKECKKILKNF